MKTSKREKQILELLNDREALDSSRALNSEEVTQYIGLSWHEIRHDLKQLEGKGLVELNRIQFGTRIFYSLFLSENGREAVSNDTTKKSSDTFIERRDTLLGAHSSIQLNREDFRSLSDILAQMPEFRLSGTRSDFLISVYAGFPNKENLIGMINLDGPPHTVSERVINQIIHFGRIDPSQEALGVLVSRLLYYMGGGPKADFLHGLFDRYPL